MASYMSLSKLFSDDHWPQMRFGPRVIVPEMQGPLDDLAMELEGVIAEQAQRQAQQADAQLSAAAQQVQSVVDERLEAWLVQTHPTFANLARASIAQLADTLRSHSMVGAPRDSLPYNKARLNTQAETFGHEAALYFAGVFGENDNPLSPDITSSSSDFGIDRNTPWYAKFFGHERRQRAGLVAALDERAAVLTLGLSRITDQAIDDELTRVVKLIGLPAGSSDRQAFERTFREAAFNVRDKIQERIVTLGSHTERLTSERPNIRTRFAVQDEVRIASRFSAIVREFYNSLDHTSTTDQPQLASADDLRSTKTIVSEIGAYHDEVQAAATRLEYVEIVREVISRRDQIVKEVLDSPVAANYRDLVSVEAESAIRARVNSAEGQDAEVAQRDVNLGQRSMALVDEVTGGDAFAARLLDTLAMRASIASLAVGIDPVSTTGRLL